MRDRLTAGLWSALVLAFLSALFSLTPLADRIEHQYALGLLYLFRQPVDPPPGAIIIALDKQTLDWLRHPEEEKQRSELIRCLPASVRSNLEQIRGPGSLPRSIHACLLEKLKELGFKVVVIDILFGVPGTSEDDARLAHAFREHGSDDDRQDGTNILEFLPKLGVRAALTDFLTVRATYSHGYKPRLVSEQVLEPTSVAGFSQFYDGINGSLFEQIGGAIELKLSPQVMVGAEAVTKMYIVVMLIGYFQRILQLFANVPNRKRYPTPIPRAVFRLQDGSLGIEYVDHSFSMLAMTEMTNSVLSTPVWVFDCRMSEVSSLSKHRTS